MLAEIDDIGVKDQEDGLTSELEEARRIVRRIDQQFKVVHLALGNHEGRALRQLDVGMAAEAIGNWIKAPTWLEIDGRPRFSGLGVPLVTESGQWVL